MFCTCFQPQTFRMPESMLTFPCELESLSLNALTEEIYT